MVANSSLSHEKITATPFWTRTRWAVLLLALTAITLCLHGYHPLAEDGGLYVAGIEYNLNHTLFPHYTAFVQEHLRFSLFAPIVVLFVHSTHLSLAWVLLLLDLTSIWLTLFAARQILRRITHPHHREAVYLQVVALSFLAAWWTLPIAGTSLMLMDPYVTARSFSTPLTLLGIAYALDPWEQPFSPSFLKEVACITLAAAMHPLMAGYALAFVIVIRCSHSEFSPKRHLLSWLVLTMLALIVASLLQLNAPAESPELRAAAITRYYWFLSRWQWFEVLGLAAPLAIFTVFLRYRSRSFGTNASTLWRAALVIGTISILIALLFARENPATHLVARLQVLRVFLILYALLALCLGIEIQLRTVQRPYIPVAVILGLASLMCFVQRQTFPLSQHLELPWRAANNPNPWVQAFLWAKQNTPQDALFALDAKYVNTNGEDAQTFRATALRSALPDYSKDGGEAAITPALAPQWKMAADAQQQLSDLTDAARDARLTPFHATWIVLHSTATTAHPCPYNNGTVKICRLGH